MATGLFKILAIDDDADSRLLVHAVLEPSGYAVVDAVDGLSGIEAALREHPALILLDIQLTGIDGCTLAAILRTFPRLSAVPIVAVTAYALADGDRERTLIAGCDGYIEKPIDVDRFPKQIAEFLEGKRQRVHGSEEGLYLRELNQRFVGRLITQLEDVTRLNQLVSRHARQLEAIHEALGDSTSDVGVVTLLETLLPRLARALEATHLLVELAQDSGTLCAEASGPAAAAARGPAEGEGGSEVEWKVPLIVSKQPLGFIRARAIRTPEVMAESEQLFKIVARHVAIAIENSRLFETERAAHSDANAANKRLANLQAITDTALAYLGEEDLLRALLDRIMEILTVDCAAIMLLDPDTRELVTRAVKGRGEIVASTSRIPFGQGFAGRIASERRPIVIDDVDRVEMLNPLLGERGMRSLVGVPLVVEGRAIGVLHVGTLRRRQFTPDDVDLLQLVAARAALGLDHARLYAAAQAGHAAAEEAGRRKDQFLATLAHELRTPLAAMLSAVHLIQSHEERQPLLRRAREVIERQVNHQGRLLDDLLDLARLGSNKIELRRTVLDLATVVAGALDTAWPLIEARQHRVSVSLPEKQILLAADPTRLEQVVVNLLANAAKFTPVGGRITVGGAVDGRAAVIKVTDTGAGIAPEMLSRVFEPFVQAAPSEAGAEGGGLGIGLALVRRLIDLHGGTVEARSEGLGRGAEFVVRLPLERGDAAVVSIAALRGTAPAHRILIVEHDPDWRDALRTALELDNHRVEAVADGEEAVARAVATHPDVVLIAIGLPGIDAYEVARRVRAALGTGVFLVAVMGDGEHDEPRAREAGFDAHVLKPFTREALGRMLTHADRTPPTE